MCAACASPLGRGLDDGNVQQFERSTRRLQDGVREPLGLGVQSRDFGDVPGLARIRELLLALLALLLSLLDFVVLHLRHRAVEDEDWRQVVFEELRQTLDHPYEIRDLGPVGGRVRAARVNRTVVVR